jgi:hypothetical protein
MKRRSRVMLPMTRDRRPRRGWIRQTSSQHNAQGAKASNRSRVTTATRDRANACRQCPIHACTRRSQRLAKQDVTVVVRANNRTVSPGSTTAIVALHQRLQFQYSRSNAICTALWAALVLDGRYVNSRGTSRGGWALWYLAMQKVRTCRRRAQLGTPGRSKNAHETSDTLVQYTRQAKGAFVLWQEGEMLRRCIT